MAEPENADPTPAANEGPPTQVVSASAGPAEVRATMEPGEVDAAMEPGEVGATEPGEVGATMEPGEIGAAMEPGEIGAAEPGEIDTTMEPGEVQVHGEPGEVFVQVEPGELIVQPGEAQAPGQAAHNPQARDSAAKLAHMAEQCALRVCLELGGFPGDISEKDLQAELRAVGSPPFAIQQVKVSTKLKNARVMLGSSAEAQRMRAGLNGKTIRGQRISSIPAPQDSYLFIGNLATDLRTRT